MTRDADAFLDARSLPHSLDAETAVLGAILLHGEVLEAAAAKLTPEQFYRHAHGVIFDHMLRLSAQGAPVDFTTLRETLTTSGQIDPIGGPAYLASLVDGMARGVNIAHHAQIVRAKWKLRRLIQTINALLTEAYEADASMDLIAKAEEMIFAIADDDHNGSFARIGEILPRVMEQIEAWHTTRGLSGVPSGFVDLDDVTGGFQSGNLIVLAARPAMGKSALALNIAQHVASVGKSAGVFSLEMSQDELGMRALTTEAKLSAYRVQHGWIRGEHEWRRLSDAFAKLSDYRLFIDESPFVTAVEMRTKARRLKAQHGLDLLVVDYTQLMAGHERKESRTLEIASITRALKGLAKELGIPVIALSQLNRDLERREEKRPQLSDLRDSGALEQDADLVLLLYREEVYKRDTPDKGIAEVNLAKHRNGRPAVIRLGWHEDEMRFANLDEHRAADVDRRLPASEQAG